MNVRVGTDVDAVALFAGNMLIYASIIMMSATAAYLMMQVPQIAPGIISGSSRAGFQGVAQLMRGAGGAATRGATSRVGGGMLKMGRDGAKAGAGIATKLGLGAGGAGGGGGSARSNRPSASIGKNVP